MKKILALLLAACTPAWPADFAAPLAADPLPGLGNGRTAGFQVLDPSVPMRQARKEVSLDADKLQEYAGRYQLTRKFSIAVTREGARLFTQATNQVKVEVFAEAPDRFFLKAVDAQIVFERGADGKVTGLVLHQLGRKTPGKRTAEQAGGALGPRSAP